MENRHTEELVEKDYFKGWIKLRTKISLPLVWIYFFARLFKLALFYIFDHTFLLLENDTSNRSEGENPVVCNNLSCMHMYYGFQEPVCALWVPYTCVALLLFLILVSFVQDGIGTHVILKNMSFAMSTPFGKKNMLLHSVIYSILDHLSNVCILTNVIVRTVRHSSGQFIPFYVDNATFHCFYFCYTWGFLFLLQLVPYVGYIAIVIKLMMKDTVIFLLFIFVFSIPYSHIFPRIINHQVRAGECDEDWTGMGPTLYNTFLLMFNMLNFKENGNKDTSNEEIAQLYVSRIKISFKHMFHFYHRDCKSISLLKYTFPFSSRSFIQEVHKFVCELFTNI